MSLLKITMKLKKFIFVLRIIYVCVYMYFARCLVHKNESLNVITIVSYICQTIL